MPEIGCIQKVDKSIRRVCKTPLTSMYFHVCEKNYPASPSYLTYFNVFGVI